MHRPFLDALTPLLTLSGVATLLITVAIRVLWRRGKHLEEP